MFHLKSAKIYQALRWYKFFQLVRVFKNIFLGFFLAVFLFFLYGFFRETVNQQALAFLLGLSIISLTLSLAGTVKQKFFYSKLIVPKQDGILEAVLNPEEYNLAEFLDFKLAKAIQKSGDNLTKILYNLCLENRELNFIFSRALLNFKEFKKILRKPFKEQVPGDFEKAILEALKIAKNRNHKAIEMGDMIIVLAKYESVFKNTLIEANLKVQDIENLVCWLEDLKEKIEERKKFWEWKNLLKKGSLAKQWAAGYALTLDKFSIDLSEVEKSQGFPDTIGHKSVIEAVERVLARREKNNVLIVGEPGSGRKSIVRALARKSALGESFPEVNFKRVVRLDLSSLISQISSSEETESILDVICRETLAAGNIILVIDNFHNFLNISGVLAPYLAISRFQVVAITTFEGLHKSIEQDSSLLSLFEKAEVSEISEKETLWLLENLALILERKYRVFVSYQALRDIISYCARYMGAEPFPEKAMKILDEAMVYISQKKEKVLLSEHVAKIISEKIQIPVGEIDLKERKILLDLENLIHQRIINQEEAVKEVSSALRRARAEITVRKGPIGSFLFMGPTGVGKTETSKALAEIYFGSESRMIRLDMSEFQNVSDVGRLLGSPGEEGLLTTAVRENPFSLILLDEIEKAHPNILNLFLQVLDEGHLTDGIGRKVDFKNAIIIATSNAGYQIILEALRENSEWLGVKQKLLNYIFEQGIFRPEFINRFDATVVFSPLSKDNLLKIAELLLLKIKKSLAEKEIEFIITETLKEKIVELSYDPTFGARQMQRVIQDKVGNVLAKAILSNELKRGSKVEINPSDFTLKIN